MSFALLFLTVLSGYAWCYVVMAWRKNQSEVTGDLVMRVAAKQGEMPVTYWLMLSGHVILGIGSLAALGYLIFHLR